MHVWCSDHETTYLLDINLDTVHPRMARIQNESRQIPVFCIQDIFFIILKTSRAYVQHGIITLINVAPNLESSIDVPPSNILIFDILIYQFLQLSTSSFFFKIQKWNTFENFRILLRELIVFPRFSFIS